MVSDVRGDYVPPTMASGQLMSLMQQAAAAKARQVRKMQQMKRAAAKQSEQQQQRQQKELQQQLRQQLKEAERKLQRQEAAATRAQVEARRRIAIKAAERQLEQQRQRVLQKIAAADARLMARERSKESEDNAMQLRAEAAALRRKQAKVRSVQVEAQQRCALQQKQQQAEENRKLMELHRKEEERTKQQAIALRTQRCNAARQRALQEEADRIRSYQEQHVKRDSWLEQRRHADAEEREERDRQAQARAAAVKQRVHLAAIRDQQRRDQIARSIDAKMRRSTIIEQERLRLMEELQRVRQQMAIEEHEMRSSFQRMLRAGSEPPMDDLPPSSASGTVRQRFRPLSASAHGATPRHPVPEAGWERDRGVGSLSPGPSREGLRAARPRPKSAGPSPTWTRSPETQQDRSLDASPSPAPAAASGSRRKLAWDDPDGVAPGRVAGADLQALMTPQERQLAQLLKEEQRKEAEREGILRQVRDNRERMRLLRIFSDERRQAQQRILDLTGAGVCADPNALR